MADAHKNFAYSTVATPPSPALSGTSLVVAAGTGALFPAVPFNVTIWPTGENPLSTNAEIARVTNRSTDTLTITRAQESSSARAIQIGDQIAATITVKTLTDVETNIDAVSAAVNVVSNALSVTSTAVETHINTVSASNATKAAQTSLDTVSAAVNVVSQALSVASTVLDAKASLISDRVTSISAQFTSADAKISILSDKVTSISAQIVSVDTHANTASGAATSVDNRIASLSAADASLSVRTSVGGATSIHGMQSILNALSNQVSDTVTSLRQVSLDFVANDASVSAVIKADIASVSAAIRTDEASHIASTSATIKADIASVSGVLAGSIQTASAAATSVDGRVGSLSVVLASLSALSAGGASTHGLQSIINALSNRISTVVGGGSTAVSQTASAANASLSAVLAGSIQTASAAATSVDNRIASLSAADASLSVRTSTGGATSIHGFQSIFNALSNQVSDVLTSVRQVSADAIANDASLSGVLAGSIQTASAAATSVDGRVASLSVVFASLSAMSTGDVSTHGLQSIINALSNRISGVTGGTGSVTSAEAQTISDNASLANVSLSTVIKADIASVSAAIRADEASHIASTSAAIKTDINSVSAAIMADAASHLASTSAAIKADITSVSAVIKADIASVSAAIMADAASHLASTSAAIKTDINSVSAAIMADVASHLASTSAAIKTDINSVSAVLAASIQTASAAATSVGNLVSAHNIQVLYVSVANTIAAVALTNISGLAASIGISGLYTYEAMLMYTTSAAQPIKFGMTHPALNTGGGKVETLISVVGGGGSNTQSTVNHAIGWYSEAASGSTLLSLAGQATAAPVFIKGMMLCSTAGGTLQLQAGASTGSGAIVIQRGSYLKVYKIG